MYENTMTSQSFSWGHGMMNANPNRMKSTLVTKEFLFFPLLFGNVCKYYVDISQNRSAGPY